MFKSRLVLISNAWVLIIYECLQDVKRRHLSTKSNMQNWYHGGLTIYMVLVMTSQISQSMPQHCKRLLNVPVSVAIVRHELIHVDDVDDH